MIVNDAKIQLEVGGESYKSAKMDTPIYMNQDVIYCWQIKFDTIKDDVDSSDIFGVVSDECNNIGECAWGGLKDFYAISCEDAGYVWKGTTRDMPDGDPEHNTNITKKDTLTMELDCKSSQLTFKIGNKTIYGPMTLPAKKAWYPAVHLCWSEDGTSATFIKMKVPANAVKLLCYCQFVGVSPNSIIMNISGK